ncbi:MAG: winged helix-turn-helix domain-containing protein, partial [Acidobacteriota bacterium]|nr:winged helix-turn-helix domain-containing protein [Acidobacteriota bacterium]
MRMVSTVRFGSFEVNLEIRELRKQGVKIHLPDQVFEVLAKLMERPGELVSRDELRARLWGGETFVDFDAGLNKVVNRLREALSDSATNPRFIETVARRGYRLLIPVTTAQSFCGAGDISGKVRLAVLPFENMSAEPEQEFFSDGLTEEMIAELGRLNPKRLGVIARTSTMLYKNSRKRIDEIGRELNVEYILEGSVRRAGRRARITAQLIQAPDQTHLWAETYDRDIADMLQVQHEVAQRVADSLAFELLSHERTHTAAISPAGYEAYLRGRYFWNRGSGADAAVAIHWFEECLKHDSNYALAYSGIADCHGRLGWFGALPPREAGAKAKTAALLAVTLQNRLGEAHASLALVCFWHDWDWAGAEREFREAIDLNPNYAAAHNWYAAFLNVMLRFDEAAREQKIAEELDPLCLTIAMNAADPYYFARQYSSAIDRFKRVLKRDPNFPAAHYNLGGAYAQAGMYQEAMRAFETAARLSGVRLADAALGYAYARLGDIPRAVAILDEMEKLGADPTRLALILLGLGKLDCALEKLEQAFEERSFWLVYLQADPVYDDLRSH